MRGPAKAQASTTAAMPKASTPNSVVKFQSEKPTSRLGQASVRAPRPANAAAETTPVRQMRRGRDAASAATAGSMPMIIAP